MFLNLIFTLTTTLCLAADTADAETPRNFFEKAVEFSGATGSLRSAYWSKDKSFTDTNHFWVESAWLTLRPKEVLGFKSYADWYVQFENLSRNTKVVSELRELYLERSFGSFDLRVGRQIIVWGRADKLNPTDNLTVKDFRRLFSDDEDQRTGIGSIDLTYNLENIRFKSVWLPEWRSPGIPLPSVTGISFLDLKPDDSAEQFGLKIDETGGRGFDWSISYFHGYGKVPNLKVLPVTGGINLGIDYPKIDVFGFDFATAVESVGLRAEAAYTQTTDRNGLDPFAQNPFVYSVFGIENSPIENLNINLQYVNRWVSRYQDPKAIIDPTTRSIAIQSAITSQQLVRMNHGISFRPSYKLMNDTLDLEVAWVRWFTTKDQLLRPKVSYAVTDHWKIIGGAELFSGSQETFFGRLEDTSNGFLELRLSF